MKIENDLIVFGPEDIQQLSPGLQKVLAAYVGERLPPEQALSDAANRVLAAATLTIGRQRLDDLQSLAEALVLADDDKRATAEAAIKSIETDLGVVAPPPGLIEPEPSLEAAPSPAIEEPLVVEAAPEEPTFFGKIKNFFKPS